MLTNKGYKHCNISPQSFLYKETQPDWDNFDPQLANAETLSYVTVLNNFTNTVKFGNKCPGKSHLFSEPICYHKNLESNKEFRNRTELYPMALTILFVEAGILNQISPMPKHDPTRHKELARLPGCSAKVIQLAGLKKPLEFLTIDSVLNIILRVNSGWNARKFAYSNELIQGDLKYLVGGLKVYLASYLKHRNFNKVTESTLLGSYLKLYGKFTDLLIQMVARNDDKGTRPSELYVANKFADFTVGFKNLEENSDFRRRVLL